MKRLLTFLTLLMLFFGVTWAADVTDVLNRSTTGVTGSSYTNWSGKTSNSTAVYAGNSAGGNTSIQLRSNESTSGIVTTNSGGKVKSITVSWNGNTSNGRTLNIYGKNSAYSAASDLYGTNAGTLLGTIVYGASTSLTVSGDYQYIGIRSNSGALYLTSVTIVWETGGSTTETVATPTFNPTEGTFTEAQNVTISCATSGATIHYTTDGNTPTASSTTYSSAIPVSETTTIKAIAVKSGMNNSDVASATYTINAQSGDSNVMTFIPSSKTEGTLTNQPSGVTYTFNSTYQTYQITKNNTMTLTIKGMPSDYTITGIKLDVHNNASSGAGSASATMNGIEFGTLSISGLGNTYQMKDMTITPTQCNGDLVITISCTTNSVYCDKFEIYYETATIGAYEITKVCTPNEGGSINCKSSANANEPISLTVSTNDNYEFAYVEVKDASDNNVEFTEENGTYSFTMPESDVTITAHFNQAGALYILGEANGKFDNAVWQPNEGTLMTYSNGKYTARVYFKGYTKYNDGDGYSEFAFSKKLATKTAANGG